MIMPNSDELLEYDNWGMSLSDYSDYNPPPAPSIEHHQPADHYSHEYDIHSRVNSQGTHHHLREYTHKELNYYADYDPMVGYRIAVTLGTLILLFILFVLYKTHCQAKRNERLIAKATAQAQANLTDSIAPVIPSNADASSLPTSPCDLGPSTSHTCYQTKRSNSQKITSIKRFSQIVV